MAFAFPSRETYWLTRFVLLRLLGFVYVIAFLVAVNQLIPLVGSDGLTPANLFLPRYEASVGSSLAAFFKLPTLFWFDWSDTMLRVIPWIGLILSCAVAAGFANSIILAVLWALYLSIVHVGQEWYGFGWEIQLTETGFLAIFLVPLLDARPFPARPPPYALIVLNRVLIFKIMLGAGLIKLRGDATWLNYTALNYFFETEPIPNPLTVYFHFLPHGLLAFGVMFTFFVELVVPWFAFWLRPLRLASGLIMISLQTILIIGGNFAFLNWLTILPALACFDDRFLRRLLPGPLVAQAARAAATQRPSISMEGTSYVLAVLVGILSLPVALNLCSPQQRMIESYEPFELVNSYGVFGSVTQARDTLVFEGTRRADPGTATDWKEYVTVALPSDPARAPVQVAPYQPHLDWQLWFAAMGPPEQSPWALNLIWKLLHNDPQTLGLFAGNPFPGEPPRFIRVEHYIYHFAKPGNPQHVYWTRDWVDHWLPPFSADDPRLRDFLHDAGWLPAGP